MLTCKHPFCVSLSTLVYMYGGFICLTFWGCSTLYKVCWANRERFTSHFSGISQENWYTGTCMPSSANREGFREHPGGLPGKVNHVCRNFPIKLLEFPAQQGIWVPEIPEILVALFNKILNTRKSFTFILYCRSISGKTRIIDRFEGKHCRKKNTKETLAGRRVRQKPC